MVFHSDTLSILIRPHRVEFIGVLRGTALGSNILSLCLKTLILLMFSSQFVYAATWTTIVSPNIKSDKASDILMSKVKNVKAEEIIKLAENFVSAKEFESLMRDSKKVKNLQIDNIKHGEDFFYLKAGPIKIVFRWIDKDNVVFKLNGHSFSYQEAAVAEVWQNKVVEVIKSYQTKQTQFSEEEEAWFSSVETKRKSSSFVIDLGTRVTSMLVLPFLFYPTDANAFQINWSSQWTWITLGAVLITLVAHHFYKKHKKEHNKNKDAIKTRLATARKNLADAQARGEGNLSSYQSEVLNLENLLTEYNSSGDVGFFGFLFGRRASKPAMYDTIMSRPAVDTGSGSGGTGTPTAPPTGSTGTY